MAKSFMRDGNFLRFYLATVCSALGDAALLILLAWFVVDITGSEGMLGITLLLISLPRLFFMLIGGVAADRLNRKWILILSASIRGGIMILFALFLTRALPENVMYGLFPMAVVFGVVDAFFWPARSSSMPFVVKQSDLARANGLLETSLQLSSVFGMMLASQLFLLDNYSLMFSVIGSFFLVATVLLLPLRFRQDEQTDGAPQPETKKQSAFADIVEGIRYALSIRTVALILLTALFANVMIMGPLQIGLPSLVKSLGFDGTEYGFLEATISIGALIGGLIVAWQKAFRGRLRIVSLFIAVFGIAFAFIGSMQTMSYGLTVMFVLGLSMALFNIPVLTYMQTVTERHMLGRVMSLLSLMSFGITPISYALASFLLENGVLTAPMLFYIGGIGMALLGPLTFAVREFRNSEKHPRWVQAAASEAQ